MLGPEITLREGNLPRGYRDASSRTSGRLLLWIDGAADQRVAGHRMGSCERSGRQLNDRERSKGEGHPPRTYRRSHLDHAAVSRHERDVDCEAHEKRVHGAAGRDDERAPFRQRISTEQPLAPMRGVEGRQQMIRDNRVRPHVFKDVTHRTSAQQRTEERLHILAATRALSGRGQNPASVAAIAVSGNTTVKGP